MKNLYLIALLFTLPLAISAQNIHGIWSGTLVNDSTHRIQNFELGLSEYRGKITGYTYTTFIENDTFYYSIKRIKAERRNGNLVVDDVEMVGNNFPARVSKGVKQTTTFPLINDTTIDISKGHWNTNQTKRYYSIGGSAALKESNEDESDLLAHLKEMNVKTDLVKNKKKKKKEESIVANYAEAKQRPQQNNDQNTPRDKNSDVVKNSVQQPVGTDPGSGLANKSTASQTSGNENKKEGIFSTPDEKNNQAQETVTNNKLVVNTSNIQQNSSAKNNETITKSKSPVQTKAPEQKQQDIVQAAQKTDQQVNKKEELKIDNPVSMNNPIVQKEVNKHTAGLPAFVASRKNETIQDIYFKNDSLILSLYDNGIVDGDTVSVFVNGENIISKQKLKESATKKTIYIPVNSDSLQLVLFAENLGTIPPNTGLLTVRDGDDIYQVRFSADLQKNASIILRRKK